MAKITKQDAPAGFTPFGVVFETLEEAVAALALLNSPIHTTAEWIDGRAGYSRRQRITGTNYKKVQGSDAGHHVWGVISDELEAQGFYHGKGL